jgi:hypothetical protein
MGDAGSAVGDIRTGKTRFATGELSAIALYDVQITGA